MTNEKKAVDPSTVLLPDTTEVSYWGNKYQLEKLGMKKILKLIKLISRSEQKIRLSILESFVEAKSEQSKEIWVELSDAEVKFSTLDTITSALEAVAEKEIYELVSIVLDITPEEAEKWFSLWDIIWLLLAIVSQEDIEKLFLELTTLAEKMKSLR